MKTYVLSLLVLLSSLPYYARAELSWGPERDVCFKQQRNIPLAYTCLSRQKNESNKKLEDLILESDKRIKANNTGQFNGNEDASETYGDVYSRRFLKAQKIWQQYRRELCLAVASELNEDAYDYQSFIDQCEINLNRRHREEIDLMGLRPVS